MRVKEAKVHYISFDRLEKFPARVGASVGFLGRARPDEIVQACEDGLCPRCSSAMEICGEAGLCQICDFRF